MLDQSVASNVPDVDGLIFGSGGNASSIWMEFDRIDSINVVFKHIGLFFLGVVPDSNSFVLRSRNNNAVVRSKLARSDEVSMTLKSEQKFAVSDGMDLEALLMTTRE